MGPITRKEAEKLAVEQVRFDKTMQSIDCSIQTLAQSEHIREPISGASFLDPDTERVDEEEEDIFEALVGAYTENDSASEEEEDEPEIPKVTLNEALHALATLRSYEEQVEFGSREVVRALDKRERELQGYGRNTQVQREITSYFE